MAIVWSGIAVWELRCEDHGIQEHIELAASRSVQHLPPGEKQAKKRRPQKAPKTPSRTEYLL
ncbi:MAG: hypothetical protein CMI03_16530 [Oceanospirillaceae bacterium]|nr:hypothetical protein [Oceanospirillaceae bacterium]MBS54348.1 hypothetical protein [Oceanospirillaceae bacterium]